MTLNKTRTALISVSNKNGLIDFARGLVAMDIQLISTGGTATALRAEGLPVVDVSECTGFPEILDGRVKTLHPKVHGGILARRDLPEHGAAIAQHGILPIDLVVVNLYPFVQTVANEHCSLEEAIENIDIGGPAMLRAAAKNHGNEEGGVGVITDPEDYAAILSELRANQGALTYATRFTLAKKAFVHTARYDSAIANWLTRLDADQQLTLFPQQLHMAFDQAAVLRYGENPHQEAAFYRDADAVNGGIGSYRQLQGKELSYNNIADADAAWECVKTFAVDMPTCVIVKHANPCGVALGVSAEEAYRKAFDCDPTSAFGGIIAFNTTIDEACARAVVGQFAEVIIAPDISSQAAAIFAAKYNLRVLTVALPLDAGTQQFDCKRVAGGLLLQTTDVADLDSIQVVTQRAPTSDEMRDLLFAWKVAKFVKSNAIVYCRDGMTIGIGAGQMSRVDSARIAAIKAENNGQTAAGTVAASDAFFPFRDGVDVLVRAGATAVIQPGGSVRDAEVIAAADEQGIAMVFTGMRHFRH